MDKMVRVWGLWVTYGKLVAARDLSFSIPKGEVFGFIGPNGAGKTSTIKVLATLLKPARGVAYVAGIDVARDPSAVRRVIGYMPDSFGVYEDLTADQYLHFFAAAYRIPGAKRRRLVDDVLALTDLGGKREAQVETLSRGMKQRLGIARVLLHDPAVFLLDEPASGLDPRARIEMRELLKELKNMGKTILISSHILHELSALCTRIGIIEAGRLVAEGSLEEIYAKLKVLRVVHVQVTNLTDEMAENIGAIPGVEGAERTGDRMSLKLREKDLAVEDLHERIHALGARLYMFQPEAMDMETVFMKLTEGKTA